jgi:UrcA family protein
MIANVHTALIATVFLTGVALSTPSRAETASIGSPGAPSRVVRYGDLDLATPDGVRTLYGRIRVAAWKVCGEIVAARNGPSAIENGQCRRTLTDVAVRQVDKPALTALHFGKKKNEVVARRDRP